MTHDHDAHDEREHAQHTPRPQDADNGSDHGNRGGHGGHDHGANDHGGHVDHTGHEIMFRDKFFVSLALSIPVLLYSPTLQRWLDFSAPAFPGSQWIVPLFSVVVFVYGGLPFLEMAVPELRKRSPGMMTLISLAITVAFGYSMATLVIGGEPFFWELVTLIDVMLLGHWIEMRSVRQASRALDELAALMPDTAERVGPDGEVEEVPLDALEAGDVVLVRPGASVPADGAVVDGTSAVDEAVITGESEPVEKAPGDDVIGGTINRGGGSLRVRLTAVGEETALAGIMRLVDEAQASKSDTQLLADRAAGLLFYAALAVAVVTAIGWTLAVGPGGETVRRVVTVLVIACPHALGLAVPLVVAITTSLGARNGLLIRDRRALEEAREIDVVVFDKTGTLTEGQFALRGVATVDGTDEDTALALAAAVEGDSEHTLARGIRNAADERGLERPAVSGFEAIKGRGVRAEHAGRTVHLGGPRLLEMLELSVPEALATFTEDAGAEGQTVIYLVEDGAITAGLALGDEIRPESRRAVERLHEMGVEVAMLTGDSEEVARAVAETLDIDTYFAEVLPEHKDEKVKALQAEGKRVAMVGDGVNDAPALARADVGIAIGSGTDVAVESAGIVLVRSDPMDVVSIVALSKASHRKMIQNLWWASGYNIVALPLAAGVLAPIGIVLSPAVGALLMSLSTVIVAINAQLLRGADIG